MRQPLPRMLRIRTLGGLSVDADGSALSGAATQPRRLAVLALIARAGDRGITRDALIARLWPDTPEESARRALAQSLHALRRDLGHEDLFLGVQEIRLNRAAAACDVMEFEEALAGQELERAASSWGGPFLDGFRLAGAPEFDRWVEEERAGLTHRYHEVLERLGRNAMERSDPVAAVRWWRRLAGHDPLNARIAVELMRALAAAGERHAALQHARIYEALVAQELAVEPDRQVLELAEELRRAPSPAAPAPGTPPSSPAPPAMEPAAPLPAEPPPAVQPLPTRRGHLVGVTALLALVAVVLALLWPSRAREPAGHLLAVGAILDYRADGATRGDPVGEMLATNLARVPGLQVLSSARLLELLEGAEQTGDARGAWARAARRAGATELLEGGLHQLAPDRLLLELRRTDLTSGAVRTAYRLEGADPFELVARATGEIAASMGQVAGALDPADVSTRSLVAYRFYEEGLRAFSRGDFRGAEQLLEAALREDSLFALAAYYRWQARNRRGHLLTPGELDQLRGLSTRAPDRERLLIRAWLAFASDEPTLHAHADTLAVRYPAELDGHYLLGYAHLLNGAWDSALAHLERVFALDSASLGSGTGRCVACDALEQIVHAYHALDSLPHAERLARDWTRRDPRSARAHLVLAGVLFAQGRHAEAIAARRSATAEGPVDVYDAVFPAAVRLRAGEFAEVDRVARALLRDAPDADAARQARWLLLLSLRYQSRWREALELVRDPLPAGPGPRPVTQTSPLATAEALIHLEAGRPARAAAIWDSLARAREAGEAEGNRARRAVLQHTLSAVAWAGAGDTVRLRQAVDSVNAIAGRGVTRRASFYAAHARGVLARARGDTATAIAEFGDAIFSPTLGFTRSNRDLAELLLARGRSAEAVPLLRAALGGPLDNTNLYVTHTELHELLGVAWSALGRADSAAAHLRYVEAALAGADPEARPRLERARRLAAP